MGETVGRNVSQSKAGCPGSLMSCPGPKRAAAAAMCDSGYCETLHNIHLLLSLSAMTALIAQYSLFFRPLTEKSNNTGPYMSMKRFLQESTLSSFCAGNANMSNIPNAFYWHGPNSFHSKDKRCFCSLWSEWAFYMFSLVYSLLKD